MKAFILGIILTSGVFAQTQLSDERKPQTREEQEAFQEWDMEEQEARSRAERERWILEERARGYEPTSERYKPAVPKKPTP